MKRTVVLFLVGSVMLLQSCTSLRNDEIARSGEVIVRVLSGYIERDAGLSSYEKEMSKRSCQEYLNLIRGE